MFRRSSRLQLSGYYLNEDDTASTSSAGLIHRISYKESPVRTLRRRSWAHRDHSSNPNSTMSSVTELMPVQIDDFNDGGDEMDKTFTVNNTLGFTSGYSSAQEDYYISTPKGSIHSLENPKFGLADVFESLGRTFDRLVWWLKSAWLNLTSKISWSDVVQLSSSSVKNIIVFLSLICMFVGIWYCLSLALPHHLSQTEMQHPLDEYTNTPMRANSSSIDTSLDEIKHEIVDVREREAKMMREITWLKLENQKQKLRFEILQQDVAMQDRNIESDYQQQISDLRSDVSNVRETSNLLKQRMDLQKPLSTKDVNDIVQKSLSLQKADSTGMADYALESSGGSVVNSRCSETYQTRSALVSLFGIPLWFYSESPRTVIQPEVYPGKCWAFRGSKGFLVISLSYPIRITHITLEHIPKALSPTGQIDSAPKHFAVYGLSSKCDGGQLLGTFMYDHNGESIQTFKLPESTRVHRMVELRILSNWGHSEYTCIYRFRVHGEPWETRGLEEHK